MLIVLYFVVPYFVHEGTFCAAEQGGSSQVILWLRREREPELAFDALLVGPCHDPRNALGRHGAGRPPIALEKN